MLQLFQNNNKICYCLFFTSCIYSKNGHLDSVLVASQIKVGCFIFSWHLGIEYISEVTQSRFFNT